MRKDWPVVDAKVVFTEEKAFSKLGWMIQLTMHNYKVDNRKTA